MATQFNRPPLRRITDFKSKLVGGGARPNLFEVELAFPEELAIDNDVKDKSRFLVKAAALPASNITPIDVNFRGRILKIAGDRTFDTWTITVINDTDFSIRSAFEKWMNSINRYLTQLVKIIQLIIKKMHMFINLIVMDLLLEHIDSMMFSQLK